MPTFATGFSLKEDVSEAVREAVSKAKEKLRVEPRAALVFASKSKYPDHRALAEELHRALGGIPFAGVSTAGEYTDEGVHRGSLSVLLIGTDEVKLGVGVAEGVLENPVKAGYEAAMQALGSVADFEFTVRAENIFCPPLVALVLSAPGREEDVLHGVRRAVGCAPQILGGSSGDDYELKPPFGYQLANGESYTGAVVVALLASNLRVGVAGEHPYKYAGKRGLATKAEGARSEVLVEIDGRPALEVYSEWVGKSKEEVSKNMLSIGLESPIGLLDHRGRLYYVKHPAMVDGDKIVCFAEVPEGKAVHLLKAKPEETIQATDRALEKAVRRAKTAKPRAAILIHCAGSAAFVGDKISRTYEKIKARLKGAALIGFNSYGEQWARFGGPAVHQNLTTAFLVIGEEKAV